MDNQLKRIGLLGGTFDPIHNGHLSLAEQAIQLFDLQKVLLIPVSHSPHKLTQQPTDSAHRVAMLQLALKGKTRLSIELMEIEKGGISYTIETLTQLKSLHPDWELFLILGADAFLSMDTWKNYEGIFKLCHVLVSTRPGVKLELPDKLCQTLALDKSIIEKNNSQQLIALKPVTGNSIQVFQIPPQNISSNEIRHRVQKGKEIKNLLPPAVDHYIMHNLLYRTESPPIVV